jgi:hypothetical protein
MKILIYLKLYYYYYYIFDDLDSSRFILGMNFFADANLAGSHLESKGYCSELGCKGGSIPPIHKNMKLLHVVFVRA